MEPIRSSHPEIRRKRFDRLRSLTRLTVGGIELGWEEFWRRLEEWESMVNAPESLRTSTALPPDSITRLQSSSPNNPDAPAYSTAAEVIQNKSGRDVIRLAAIGWIFQAEDNLRDTAAKSARVLRSAQSLALSLSEPFRGPASSEPITKPIRQRFNRLVNRGEMELASWIRTGEEQERESQQLAHLAWKDTTEDSIDFLASNPSVQELVQTQSTGLAAEVIEEVRERTVSADTFLEGIARNILRKTPRAVLPEPPPEVKERAASLRPQSTKDTVKKKS